MQEYEERAVKYAQNPALLQALTTKLRTNRLTCPLFDTPRWVRLVCHLQLHEWTQIMTVSREAGFSISMSDLRLWHVNSAYHLIIWALMFHRSAIWKGLTSRCGIYTAREITRSLLEYLKMIWSFHTIDNKHARLFDPSRLLEVEICAPCHHLSLNVNKVWTLVTLMFDVPNDAPPCSAMRNGCRVSADGAVGS